MDSPGEKLDKLNQDFVFNITHIFMHPKYDPEDTFLKNDIALVKLDRPVDASIATPVTDHLTFDNIDPIDVEYAIAIGDIYKKT